MIAFHGNRSNGRWVIDVDRVSGFEFIRYIGVNAFMEDLSGAAQYNAMIDMADLRLAH